MAGKINAERDYREKLLRTVKKEVKQIMEEAVTRKFVHEGSSTVTSLCGAVEACLSHGLRRRALGLFKTSSTTALLHKVAKRFEPAAQISKMVQDIETADPNKLSSSGDSTSKSTKTQHGQSQSQGPGAKAQSIYTPYITRYLWIRLALFEKQLSAIIDHLVQNSNKYYEKDSLVADPVDGQILASLLVGPCALDYSKMKTQDHLWTDLPADELVQRHRISGVCLHSAPTTPPTGRRLALHIGVGGFRRPVPSGTMDENACRVPQGIAARDYVESLHQNSKATLLYGKNNVLVQPKENVLAMPGYLSLHQSADLLTIKWTPNQLMNGCYGDGSSDGSESREDKSVYWEYALNVNLVDIVYVHCHQQPESGGTIVLVGQDGVQRPPIHFPKGGHLLAFLSCLENGLLPHGQLDPPLWSQRGKGKVFPKLRRKGRVIVNRKDSDVVQDDMDEEDEASDFVFRILSNLKPEGISQEMLDPKLSASGRSSSSLGANNTWTAARGAFHRESASSLSTSARSSASSNSSTKSLSLAEDKDSAASVEQAGASLLILCDTMKRQIVSRAFYGWLAYCRHLRTVRTHLSGLVIPTMVSNSEPTDASTGLTLCIWMDLHKDGRISDATEVYRLIYFGGVQHEIRKEVWPYLLGHYLFDSTPEERSGQDTKVRQKYETTMSEWLAVEAIVRQRDRETVAAQLAKLSSESTNGEIPLVGRDHTLSNEVFEDGDHSDEETEETCDDGSQSILALHPDHGHLLSTEEPELTALIIKDDSDEDTKDYDSEDADEKNDEETNKEQNDEGKEGECNESRLTEDVNGVERQDSLLVEEPASCLSSASSNGGVYSVELLDLFALNLHRIDKDVQRCDRNYFYFTSDNLNKLRNVMCTYVWEHLEIGYVQGMCDLVAPLLVIFDDEAKTYSCFCELMKRMAANFPHGGAMDSHFANMRSLIQILDSEMFELMQQNGDYTHFYFCYRWFLLDFKRELVYDDVFSMWETIWVAKYVASGHFVLFIALALVEYYRDVILGNNMDFTDIIKFFNEMAEHHDAKAILRIARDLVLQLQTLIDNK